jgi:hypothetical protein
VINLSLAKEFWSYELYENNSSIPFLLNFMDTEERVNHIDYPEEYNGADQSILIYKGTEPGIDFYGETVKDDLEMCEYNFAFTGESVSLYFVDELSTWQVTIYLDEKEEIQYNVDSFEANIDRGLYREEIKVRYEAIVEFLENELDVSKVYFFEYDGIYRNC